MRLLLAAGLVAGLAQAARAGDPFKEWAKLPPVGPDFRPTHYHGRVVGFTKTGAIVKPEGECLEVEVVRQPDGVCKEVALYRQDNTLPPREFVFDPCLYPNRPRSWRFLDHYATDVQIGDVVHLQFQKTNGVPVCVGLMIFRRPGGLVPPAIGDDKQDVAHRICTRRNAEQYVEEKLVPALLPRLPKMVPHPNR